MLVLALDTATEACLAGVVEVDQVAQVDQAAGLEQVAGADAAKGEVRLLASRAPVDAKRHGELLASLITEVLADAGARAADLGGVVVGLGPGPFTSLRVGIVTGASLADAIGVRAVGVCTLDAIAGAVPPEAAGEVVVATDARRREVYWARYTRGARVEGPAVDRPATLTESLDGWGPGIAVAGSGPVLYPELARHVLDVRFPDPSALVRLGLPTLLADAAPGPLAPLYLRRPDAVPPGAPKAAAQPARAGAR